MATITHDLSCIFCDVILHEIVAMWVASLLTLKVHLCLTELFSSLLGLLGLKLLIGDRPSIYVYLT